MKRKDERYLLSVYTRGLGGCCVGSVMFYESLLDAIEHNVRHPLADGWVPIFGGMQVGLLAFDINYHLVKEAGRRLNL